MAGSAHSRLFFVFSALFLLSVAVYLSFSLLWLAPVPRLWCMVLSLLLVLLSQCLTVMRLLTLRKPPPNLRLIRAGGFLSASFMLLSWLVLLRDAALALLLALNTLHLVPVTAFANLPEFCLSLPFESGMAAASLVLAAAGICRALRVPEVVHRTIRIPRLPTGLEGLRLVHLSDLHIGFTFDKTWLEAVTARVNALAPDFVFITGDLADGPPERLAAELCPLSRLRAAWGVLLCPGNHDYGAGLRDWTAVWRSWGLIPLVNEHRVCCLHGETLIVGGVADPCAARFGLALPDVDKAFQNAPKGFRILLAHRPGDAAKGAGQGCGLLLSGHTHGGQFFFLYPLVSRLNHGFRSGLYRLGSMYLHVCPGTGMWGHVPMRLGVSAEISLLELRREDV